MSCYSLLQRVHQCYSMASIGDRCDLGTCRHLQHCYSQASSRAGTFASPEADAEVSFSFRESLGRPWIALASAEPECGAALP